MGHDQTKYDWIGRVTFFSDLALRRTREKSTLVYDTEGVRETCT
jgi:hypothetical protein